jgi:hypothetical protein
MKECAASLATIAMTMPDLLEDFEKIVARRK